MGVCIATSTLELGIDIGDVDGVVLMGPPPSTMAFLQRIGRGNRRQQYINFWGICYGQSAGMQLVRFLAFFELAKEHRVEKCLQFRELQRAISANFILSLREKSSIKRFVKPCFSKKNRRIYPAFFIICLPTIGSNRQSSPGYTVEDGVIFRH